MSGDTWRNVEHVGPATWQCGFCSKHVGASNGYCTSNRVNFLRVCPLCNKPSYFYGPNLMSPLARPGAEVPGLPADVQTVYDEARSSIQAGAFTGAVLLLRKMLMHVAVCEGAETGKTFEFYVNYLDSNHHLPPKAKAWMEKIRKYGNLQTHQIQVADQAAAEALLTFTTLMLRNVYEMALAPP